MRKITKKDWENQVKINCNSSYGLVVALAVLMLWESGVSNEAEAERKLQEFGLGLSGAQAGIALSLALTGKPTGWLDKTMVQVMQSR